MNNVTLALGCLSIYFGLSDRHTVTSTVQIQSRIKFYLPFYAKPCVGRRLHGPERVRLRRERPRPVRLPGPEERRAVLPQGGGHHQRLPAVRQRGRVVEGGLQREAAALVPSKLRGGERERKKIAQLFLAKLEHPSFQVAVRLFCFFK